MALKDNGFGYVTLKLPVLGIEKGIQYKEGDDINAIAIDIIKQEFEEDCLGLYGSYYVPPIRLGSEISRVF